MRCSYRDSRWGFYTTQSPWKGPWYFFVIDIAVLIYYCATTTCFSTYLFREVTKQLTIHLSIPKTVCDIERKWDCRLEVGNGEVSWAPSAEHSTICFSPGKQNYRSSWGCVLYTFAFWMSECTQQAIECENLFKCQYTLEVEARYVCHA